jgi:hypothetical protein
MLSLSFRNESDAVIQKAKARASKSRSRPKGASAVAEGGDSRASETPTASFASTTSLITHSDPGLPAFLVSNYNVENIIHHANVAKLPTVTIHPSLEERGINYFFGNSVSDKIGGSFYYLNSVVRHGIDDVLKACVVSTGLAALSNASKSPQLMGHARKEYSLALRHMNAALASPTDAIKDSTLIGIMILAFYESTAGAWMLTLRAWTHHINGAATLVRLRGRSQFRTHVGRGIFLQATTHILISCMQREICIPPQIIELRNEAFSKIIMSFCYYPFLLGLNPCSFITRLKIRSRDLGDFRCSAPPNSLDCETLLRVAGPFDRLIQPISLRATGHKMLTPLA